MNDRRGRKNFARRRADAFLHLLELPQRDAHARILPAAEKLQKQKRRVKIFPGGVFQVGQTRVNDVARRFDFYPAHSVRLDRTACRICQRIVAAQTEPVPAANAPAGLHSLVLVNDAASHSAIVVEPAVPLET